MGLLQNYAVLNAEPMHYIGAGSATVTVAAASCMDRARRNRPDQNNNQFITEADVYDSGGHSQLQKAGKPYGYGPPYQFVMPMKSGSMLANISINGEGVLTAGSLSQGVNLLAPAPKLKGIGSLVANAFLGYYMQALTPKITGVGAITTSLTMGINLDPDVLLGEGILEAALGYLAGIESDISGAGILEGLMTLPIGMSSSIVGEGAVVANMVGLAILLVALEGEGALDADFRAMAQLATGLTGDGDLVNPTLKAIAWCVADLLGEGTADGSNLRGDCYMASDITVSGDLVTAQSCAAAVWNAIAAAYNDDGTMGKAMNSAGTAGDPWTGIMAGYTDDATFGAFVKKLLTTNGFFGLR